jgi:hypothetical protein
MLSEGKGLELVGRFYDAKLSSCSVCEEKEMLG